MKNSNLIKRTYLINSNLPAARRDSKSLWQKYENGLSFDASPQRNLKKNSFASKRFEVSTPAKVIVSVSIPTKTSGFDLGPGWNLSFGLDPKQYVVLNSGRDYSFGLDPNKDLALVPNSSQDFGFGLGPKQDLVSIQAAIKVLVSIPAKVSL